MTNDNINLIRRLLGREFTERKGRMLAAIDDETSSSFMLEQYIEEYREINKAITEFNDWVEKQEEN